MPDPGLRERIGPALGKIASGLYIATGYDGDGKRLGMLCSFVEQAGFEPPMISLAISRDRPFLGVLEGNGIFGLNILGKDDGSLMKPFFKDPDPFANLEVSEPFQGAPKLDAAWGWLACRVHGRLEGGDHLLFLGEVLDGSLKGEGEPMVRVRRDGFGY